jgi:hypothetical protein
MGVSREAFLQSTRLGQLKIPLRYGAGMISLGSGIDGKQLG